MSDTEITAAWNFKLHQQLLALGATTTPEMRSATISLYTPMHPTSLQHRVLRDISYGPDARHRLDLHLPMNPSTKSLPVFCFVHGGGFVGGDKTRSGEPFYDNICRWAVESNFVAVNIAYRFAPNFKYPAAAEDVAAALHWVEENVTEYGGDPSSVVIMGHSAGSAHVASFVANAELCTSLPQPLAGVILSSGIYDPSMKPANWSAYYGEDRSLFASRSSVGGVCATKIPLLVSVAEFDPPHIQSQTRHLVDTYFEQRGVFPELVQAEGHNHFSVMLHIGTSETWFSDRLRRFVNGVNFKSA